jgi:hypothetical protein
MTKYTAPPTSCIHCRKVLPSSSVKQHYFAAHTVQGQKHILRAGIKGGDRSKLITVNKVTENRQNYLSNPTLCAECSGILQYEKRHNKFCSNSCSAKFNNKNRSADVYEKSRATLRATLSSKPGPVKKYCKVSFCKICSAVIPFKHKKSCSDTCKNEIHRARAKDNPALGGNKNNRAYGWYESPTAGRVWLESSYEHKVAVELDSNAIEWTRPGHFEYTLNGKNKKYFPDFYLPGFDAYLDPKNDFLIKTDEEKIKLVEKTHKIRVLVLNKNQLTLTAIRSVLGTGFEPA